MKPHIKRYKLIYGDRWMWVCSGDDKNAVAPTKEAAQYFWEMMTGREPTPLLTQKVDPTLELAQAAQAQR
jgi:hypothetical protein